MSHIRKNQESREELGQFCTWYIHKHFHQQISNYSNIRNHMKNNHGVSVWMDARYNFAIPTICDDEKYIIFKLKYMSEYEKDKKCST